VVLKLKRREEKGREEGGEEREWEGGWR